MPGGTLTHLSPGDQQERLRERLSTFSMRLIKPLWGGGILTFIVVHIWQAYDDPHFPVSSPGWVAFCGILAVPLVLAPFFALTSVAIASLVRGGQLDLRGVEVIGKTIPGTEMSGGENDEATIKVEFQTSDGVHHQVRLETYRGRYGYIEPMHIRYDPYNLSNVVAIREPRPSWHLIWVLASYCGHLLKILALLGWTLICLALFLLCCL